jgi:hypothetical protein
LTERSEERVNLVVVVVVKMMMIMMMMIYDVPHNLISAQKSPDPLLNFQTTPKA